MELQENDLMLNKAMAILSTVSQNKRTTKWYRCTQTQDNCGANTQWQEVLLALWISLFEERTDLTQHITSFSSTTRTHTPLTKRQCMRG
jgi:hypothetical protein